MLTKRRLLPPTAMTEVASGADAAPMTTFKKLYPAEYLQRHLEQRVREDGRAFTDGRPASVAVGTLSHARGSALVRWGQSTMVVAGVHAQLCKPAYERPNEGFLVPTVDLSPLCSPQYKAGPPGEDAQVMAHQLQMFLNASNILPRSSLCVEEGVAVWSIFVDVVCLSADGSVLDAAALAAVAALHQCRLPVPRSVPSVDQAVFDAHDTQPLALHGMPILATFGVHDSTYLLADMTAFEESLAMGRLHLGLVDGADSEEAFWSKVLGHCAVREPRELAFPELVQFCLEHAQRRAAQLRALLRDACVA